MNDFIYVHDNAFDETYCNEVINYFEKMNEAGFGFTRKAEGKPKYEKDDITIFSSDIILRMASTYMLNHFSQVFWSEIYPIYCDQYDILQNLETHNYYQLRIQKTKIGGGYHSWHCESGSRTLSTRLLAISLFLNTVEEGGETEFLYYPKRVKAETGRFLIFPAGFTHTHRGNPPISNEKYIITGWIEF